VSGKKGKVRFEIWLKKVKEELENVGLAGT
jgi:hypothetical protein